MLKLWLYRFVGLLVSALFVYLAVRKVDLSESFRVLRTTNGVVLGAATLVYLTGIPARAMRWRLILRAQKTLSLREILVPMLVGHMANNVLPARAGEVYRAHFLGRRVRTSRSGVVGSIVVERTFDGLALVCLMSLVVMMFPRDHSFGVVAVVMGLMFLGLAAAILFYGLTADRADKSIEKGVGLLPQVLREFIGARLGFFLRGVRGFLRTGGIPQICLWTVLIFAIETGAIALAVLAFGVVLPLSGYLLVFTLVALSTALPSGPGYIGPYQDAFVLALGVFAVSRESALAISVAAQIALLGSVTVLGLAFLWRENVRAAPLPRDRTKMKSEREKVG